MPNNIVAPRVALTDPRTGLISREWYLFFFALYDLVLSGNSTSIADLQVGPPSGPSTEQFAEMMKALDAMGIEPPPPDVNAIVTAAVQAFQLAQPPLDTLDLSAAIQGLQVAPPVVPEPLALPAVRTATTTPVTITSAEALVGATIYVKLAAPGAVAVSLPAGFTGATVIVKDGTGDALVNNITTTPAAGNIDGAATDVIAANYASRTYRYTGTEWSIV